MAITVVKANGKTQPYIRKKVLNTCERLGATRGEAEMVAEKIEKKLYDGIETRKILQLIFRELQKFKPEVKCQICLRKALSLMKSKPDFERFVQLLLKEHGYTVIPNRILRGRCVEHEVDAIATKDGETYIVEIKHHANFHTPTGLDESRIARAVLEDVTEGFEFGLTPMKIDRAMIVSNTKLSGHARRYAECKQIRHVGWNSPANRGLQMMIEEKKLYPITFLKGLNSAAREKLTSAGIIVLKQIINENPEKLRRKTKISEETFESILKKAKTILANR